MSSELDRLLAIPKEQLGENSRIRVVIAGDQEDIAQRMAEDIASVIRERNQQGEPTRLILPVGPVDQFPILADICNREKLSLRNAWLFNMDEYLTDDDQYIPKSHPLSFRAYMDRKFYDLLDPTIAPSREQRIFPIPHAPELIQETIHEIGGIDVCYGGIGINGHIAFNEPPEEGKQISTTQFADLPTRVLSLSCQTRTINSVTVGGEISVIPKRAVTIGMREILASQSIRIYCNRPWQRGIVRRTLHGRVTSQVPASLLQTHPDVTFTLADYVADPPDIRLR